MQAIHVIGGGLAGSEAAWSCEAGVCRYPGFNYKYQLESTAE